MPKSDVVINNISNCSINSPKAGTLSVKASHWRNVKDSLGDLWSPGYVLQKKMLSSDRKNRLWGSGS